MKMLTGLLRPTAGEARVLGADLSRDGLSVKGRIGVVPDGLALFERLSGAEMLRIQGQLYGLDRAVAARRADELLEAMELAGEGGKLVQDYSHGMKKKLALACALIHGPELLFLDEPFEGIDAVAVTGIRRMLQDLVPGAPSPSSSPATCSRWWSGSSPTSASSTAGELVAQGTLEEVRATGSLEEIFIRLVGDERPRRPRALLARRRGSPGRERRSSRALVELRARLLWRRFTARGGIAEGVASVVLLAIAVPVGVGFAVAVGFGAYQAVRAGGGLRSRRGRGGHLLRPLADLDRGEPHPERPGGARPAPLPGLPDPARPGLRAWDSLTGIVGDPMGARLGRDARRRASWARPSARPGAWLALLLLVARASSPWPRSSSWRSSRRCSPRSSPPAGSGSGRCSARSASRWASWRSCSGRPTGRSGPPGTSCPRSGCCQWLAWPAAFPAAAARDLFAGRSAAQPALDRRPRASPPRSPAGSPTGVALAAGARRGRFRRGGGRAGRPRSGRPGLPGRPLRRRSSRRRPGTSSGSRWPGSTPSSPRRSWPSSPWKVEPRIPAEAGEVVRALPLFGVAALRPPAPAGLLAERLRLGAGRGARPSSWRRSTWRRCSGPRRSSSTLYSLLLFLASAAVMAALGQGARPGLGVRGGAASSTRRWRPGSSLAGNLVSILRPQGGLVRHPAELGRLHLLRPDRDGHRLGGDGALRAPGAARRPQPSRRRRWWRAGGSWGCSGPGPSGRRIPREARLLADRRDEFLPAVCGDDA